MPFAFTEHGVLMLSSLLNSDRALHVNIQIMRIYTRLRRMLLDDKEILLKIERLERTVGRHDQNFKIVFDHLKELLNPKVERLTKIGFRQKSDGKVNSDSLR